MTARPTDPPPNPSTPLLSLIRRVLSLPLIRIPLLGGILFLIMGICNGFMQTYRGSTPTVLALVLLMVALALAIYRAFVRLVEARPVSELAASGAGREFGLGLLLGFGLYSTAILILWLLGHYRVDGLNPWTAMLPIIPIAISSAFLEELIYRGVLFRVTEEYLGSWIALIGTAAFFGARHLGNPGATVTGSAFVAVEGGVLLAAAFMLTRRLWLPIGLHLSWNFAQAGIFSGDVSGVDMPPGLLRSAVEGPALMTGGTFGVEGSLVAFLLCAAAALVVLVMAAQGNGAVPPAWARHGAFRP